MKWRQSIGEYRTVDEKRVGATLDRPLPEKGLPKDRRHPVGGVNPSAKGDRARRRRSAGFAVSGCSIAPCPREATCTCRWRARWTRSGTPRCARRGAERCRRERTRPSKRPTRRGWRAGSTAGGARGMAEPRTSPIATPWCTSPRSGCSTATAARRARSTARRRCWVIFCTRSTNRGP